VSISDNFPKQGLASAQLVFPKNLPQHINTSLISDTAAKETGS
jgi:hypothetical protein